MIARVEIEGTYCVYIHKLDGKIFWVGHGNLRRPYIFSNRSRYWKDYVQDRKQDVEIEIIKYFEDKKEAYEYEIEYSIQMRENGEPVQGLIGHKLNDELKLKCCGVGHVSPEGRKRISESSKRYMTGRKLSEETRKKLSESHKGKPGNNKGKICTEEEKQRIKAATKVSMMAKKINREKHFNISRIEIDGVDRCGKNTLVSYISLLSNFKYIIYDRGILSQLVYNDLYNRGEDYSNILKDNKNTIVIHLWGELKDLEIRHKITNEKPIDILEHRNMFMCKQKELLDNGIFVFNYNTSKMTPYKMAQEIIQILDYIEEENKK